MILGQDWFFVQESQDNFFVISVMYYKIIIWANVTKFGQNFTAPPIFLGWYAYDVSSVLLGLQ